MNQVDNILVGGEDFVKVNDENPFSGSLGDHREECSHTHTQKKNRNVCLEGVFVSRCGSFWWVQEDLKGVRVTVTCTRIHTNKSQYILCWAGLHVFSFHTQQFYGLQGRDHWFVLKIAVQLNWSFINSQSYKFNASFPIFWHIGGTAPELG